MNIVCLASDFKGNPYLRRAKERGCHVTLVTKEKHLRDEWLWNAVDAVQPTSNTPTIEEYVRIVTHLSRSQTFDRVCPMDEFDVLPAAYVRAHLHIEGQGIESAMLFRDKLAMRFAAQKAGIPMPEFVPLFNAEEIVNFAERVKPPWILKPRTEVSAFGIRKLASAEELWGESRRIRFARKMARPSFAVFARKFVAGNVFHVDSIVENGVPIFSGVSSYGKPPMKVTHEGGVFTTKIYPLDAPERIELLDLNHRLITAFNLKRGVAHAEFLQSEKDGKFYLLEIASRVGGAYIADALEAATGINLWAEWASVDVATAEKPYRLPQMREHYAGVVLTLANHEKPDTSAYTEAEIVYRIKNRITSDLSSPRPEHDRVEFLLNHYAERFQKDFMVFAPARERHDS